MEAKGTKEDEVRPMDAGDLASQAKHLNETKGASETDALNYDKGTADAFAVMYEKNNGDYEAIFEQLGENARKVKKYPPKDAEEFGRKYAQGFYECLDEGKPEAKGGPGGSKK
jgi:hypothetical protein